MKKTIILIKPLKSKKFNVIFPSNVKLNYFVDSDKDIFAEHPILKNVYIRVNKKNIKE
jgi:hypothetical protein